MTAQLGPEAATAVLTDYVLSTSSSSIPDAVRREGLRSFVNILGCTIGGASHDAVNRTWTTLAPYAGTPEL